MANCARLHALADKLCLPPHLYRGLRAGVGRVREQADLFAIHAPFSAAEAAEAAVRIN